ncbi:SSI family serine proteinase inhibitor [Actinoplanes sp. NPDC049265]|uniref:SSI family serine proteinase inhibitor n=1 Tax=Actinoplanes sp. NPDC049265 TaxID=3363902 RepID=UPI00371E8EED
MRTMAIASVTAIVLATGSVAAGSPAHAAGGGPDQDARAGKTTLTLAYTAGAGYTAAVVVTCDPAGGVHPKVKKVCKTLRKVKGDPARLKPVNGICTLQYAPVTAEITGTWRGRKVDWSRTFGNTCEMARATGVLFTF